MTNKIILIGSDPELFTRYQGKISSVAGKLGCDKWNKLKVSDDINLQEDNVLVEFDISPSDNFLSFEKKLQDGIRACADAVYKVGHELAPGVSSHSYSLEELKSFHESVFMFGCEADMDALTMMRNSKPEASDIGLRTAGGHVHFGYENHLPEIGMSLEDSQCIMGVMCDYHLALPGLLIDKDDRRRELYGKASCIRPKAYGIEYRTLSNFWIFEHSNRSLIWEQGHKAFSSLFDKAYERLIALVEPMEIKRVINEADRKSAEKYIKMLGVI